MKVVVLQPSYLPWLGYFDQIARADNFVFYDDVQFDKNGWRNRNKIKTPKGEQWLTVPVKLKNHMELPINKIEIDNGQNWRRKHLASLEINYTKARYFEDFHGFFTDLYARDWHYLVELSIYVIKEICGMMGLKRKFFFASGLNIFGERTERLVNICKHLGADCYLTGDAAKDYLQEDMFAKNSIKLEYQNYRHPQYRQLYGDFLPYMSIVDLLFNCGKESLDILLDSGRGN